MNQLSTLIYGDIRQIFRDQTLTTFLFVPFILLLAIGLGVPQLTTQFPEIKDYHHYIMMGAGIQTSTIFGFITAFIILNEKDEQVLQVIRVLPISPFYFMTYRLFFATIFSFFGAFLLIQFSGIAYPGLGNAILLSVQYGLVAPLIMLFVTTFANNKVEGMAYFKGFNLLILIPLVSFFLPNIFSSVFVFIPTYWTYQLYDQSLVQTNVVGLFSVGLAVYTIAIILLTFQFKRRVFDR